MPYHILGNHKYELLGRDYTLKDIAEPSDDTKTIWKSYIKR